MQQEQFLLTLLSIPKEINKNIRKKFQHQRHTKNYAYNFLPTYAYNSLPTSPNPDLIVSVDRE